MNDFADFFGARRDIAYRAVLVAVGDRATAEDAVAEAFARAYQHWSSVRNHPNPTAWVIRAALNVSRSWWRRKRKVDSAAVSHIGESPVDRFQTRHRSVWRFNSATDTYAPRSGDLRVGKWFVSGETRTKTQPGPTLSASIPLI